MTDYATMTDEELVEKHSRLLRIQRSELTAGNREAALRVARERDDIWTEAQGRGIEDEITA